MVTFACKRIRKEELIKCSFDLNKTEYNVLMFLLGGEKKYSISQIVKEMNLERTTIQKAVKSLVDKNLINRTQKNLSNGGYLFLYQITNKKEIKNKMRKIIYKWYKEVEKRIDKL